MLEKLQAVASRYEELCAKAEQPDFYADPAPGCQAIEGKKRTGTHCRSLRRPPAVPGGQRRPGSCWPGETDPEMKELCQEQFQTAKETEAQLEQELKLLLLPKDPNDEKNVIVEIRGGVGGEESALFAHSLFRMYSMYAAAPGLDRGAA